ncbi:hypothetical protein PG996_004105 [Apiospora saccharicola]|uniref:Uncharacterized protein n=1 Tax=Apiospora saccharicola TaxID=335842 RepID=A0ABR1W367_9PEZI
MDKAAAEPLMSGDLPYRHQRLYAMRRTAFAMARPIFDRSSASLLGQAYQDRLWEAVQRCIRDVTIASYSNHHLDNSAPGTLFPYHTMVTRAVETVLSDDLELLQFDMGDGNETDESLHKELM